MHRAGWLLLLRSVGFTVCRLSGCGGLLGAVGFSCCGVRVLGSAGSVAVAAGLSCPEAGGIFPPVSPALIGRRTLYHWTTREVQLVWLNSCIWISPFESRQYLGFNTHVMQKKKTSFRSDTVASRVPDSGIVYCCCFSG